MEAFSKNLIIEFLHEFLKQFLEVCRIESVETRLKDFLENLKDILEGMSCGSSGYFPTSARRNPEAIEGGITERNLGKILRGNF